MASENETIADIVAAMRNESHAGDESCLEWVGAKMRTYADRIEAAAKREREATREKSSQVGNAAAMREALSDACYAMFNFLKTQNGGYEEMAKALDKAKAALADPPRNCDVWTTEERDARHSKWCRKYGIDGDMEVACAHQDMSCTLCALRWAQMPYEEGVAK